MKIGAGLLRWIYPPRCPFCRKIVRSENTLCEECAAKNPLAEPHFYLQLRQRKRAIESAAAYLYRDAVREAIGRMKFRGKQHLAGYFAEKLVQTMRNHGMTEFDSVTYVPMTRRALADRGYNQAEEIARKVAKQFGRPCEKLLQKTKENQPQHNLTTPNQRIENVRGVYAPAKRAQIAGKKILLVDDVITTGATMLSCANELYKAGAKEVICVAAAKA